MFLTFQCHGGRSCRCCCCSNIFTKSIVFRVDVCFVASVWDVREGRCLREFRTSSSRSHTDYSWSAAQLSDTHLVFARNHVLLYYCTLSPIAGRYFPSHLKVALMASSVSLSPYSVSVSLPTLSLPLCCCLPFHQLTEHARMRGRPVERTPDRLPPGAHLHHHLPPLLPGHPRHAAPLRRLSAGRTRAVRCHRRL